MSENEHSAYTLKGTYYQSMDVKGRMTFPAKLREVIGERFIVTVGSDGCLFVYSIESFDRLADKIRNLPMSQGRGLQRVLMANASEVEADKQGRILIPPALRSLAKLDKEIVVTGVSDRCEIWDRQTWDDFNNSVDLGALLDALEGYDF